MFIAQNVSLATRPKDTLCRKDATPRFGHAPRAMTALASLSCYLTLAAIAILTGTRPVLASDTGNGPEKWQPYTADVVTLKPFAANFNYDGKADKQFVMSYQITDLNPSWKSVSFKSKYSGKYAPQAGFNIISPGQPYTAEKSNFAPLNILNGPPSSKGTYTVTVPGLASESVARSAFNPNARANPDDSKSSPNFECIHFAAPFKPAASGSTRGVMWTVVGPTYGADRDPTDVQVSTRSALFLGSDNASDYLYADKMLISTQLLGGEPAPNANSPLTTTPDGQCLMATTILVNNGTPQARIWIAVYQLVGGLDPIGINSRYRNGDNYYTLTNTAANRKMVRLIALFDMPSYLRYSPNDWNGNVALCVTRNIGDPLGGGDAADGHDESQIVWLALHSKRWGILRNRFRLGYAPNGALTAYKENHAAATQFMRNDANVSIWKTTTSVIPPNRWASYPSGNSLSANNQYGMAMKTGLDGRAHLFYIDTSGKAYEEAYSWGDGTPNSGGFVYHWNDTGSAYRQQQYTYYDYNTSSNSIVLTTGNNLDQVAPIYYTMGYPDVQSDRTTAGGRAGLSNATIHSVRQSVGASGNICEPASNDTRFSRFQTTPTIDPTDSTLLQRVPTNYPHSNLTDDGTDGNGNSDGTEDDIRLIPLGVIEGPQPFPNENMQYATSSVNENAAYCLTQYTTTDTQGETDESTDDTGRAVSLKVGTKFLIGPAYETNSSWKSSKTFRTESATNYDTTFSHSISALYRNSFTYPDGVTKAGYIVAPQGKIMCRQVLIRAYYMYAADPNGTPIPGSDALKFVAVTPPGSQGSGIDFKAFDMDVSASSPTKVRPGNINSYFTSAVGDEWNSLTRMAVKDTLGQSLFITTSGEVGTPSSDVSTSTLRSTVSIQGASHDWGFMAGFNISLKIPASVPFIGGGDFSVESRAGMSFSSQQKVTLSALRKLKLLSTMNSWPAYAKVPGYTYHNLSYKTIMLAPSPVWQDELFAHLRNVNTTRNQTLLQQIIPGAGPFKITYRIWNGTTLDRDQNTN